PTGDAVDIVVHHVLGDADSQPLAVLAVDQFEITLVVGFEIITTGDVDDHEVAPSGTETDEGAPLVRQEVAEDDRDARERGLAEEVAGGPGQRRATLGLEAL